MSDLLLLTGATGFVGKRLLPALKRTDWRVRALVRSTKAARALEERGHQAVVGDLRAPESLVGIGRGVRAVCHLAAHARMADGEDPRFRVNDAGTQNLLDALRREPSLARVVFVSSIAAAARVPGQRLNRPLDGAASAEPDTAYGRSKRRAERLVAAFAAERGVDHVILRPGLVYGPGAPPEAGMNALMRAAARDSLASRFDLPGRLSVVHVEDLVRACVAALRSERAAGRTLFVAHPEPVTFGQVFRAARTALGRPAPLRPVPGSLCGILCRSYDFLDAGLGLSALLPSWKLAPLGHSLTCLPDDAEDALGVRIGMPAEPGLAQTAEAVL